jgi:hypothetical protein
MKGLRFMPWFREPVADFLPRRTEFYTTKVYLGTWWKRWHWKRITFRFPSASSQTGASDLQPVVTTNKIIKFNTVPFYLRGDSTE